MSVLEFSQGVDNPLFTHNSLSNITAVAKGPLLCIKPSNIPLFSQATSETCPALISSVTPAQ